jgi:hypothetical protein
VAPVAHHDRFRRLLPARLPRPPVGSDLSIIGWNTFFVALNVPQILRLRTQYA